MFLICLIMVCVILILWRPGRYLRASLDPMASFSQSMSPIRATAINFVPQITDFGTRFGEIYPQKCRSLGVFATNLSQGGASGVFATHLSQGGALGVFATHLSKGGDLQVLARSPGPRGPGPQGRRPPPSHPPPRGAARGGAGEVAGDALGSFSRIRRQPMERFT